MREMFLLSFLALGRAHACGACRTSGLAGAAVFSLLMAMVSDRAWAADKNRAPGPKATPAPKAAAGTAPAPASKKSRVHTFSGLDVEGKLKTPQLLFFRSRVKQELDTSTPEKRSFFKELEKSAADQGL